MSELFAIDPPEGILDWEPDNASCQVYGHCYTRDLPNGSWERVANCVDCGKPACLCFEHAGDTLEGFCL